MIRFAAAIVAVALTTTAAPAETVLYRAARMIDVTTGAVIEAPLVTVTDGRVTGIADARTVRLASTARVVDLGNRTLLPGLIDMHVHLSSDAGIRGYRKLEYTDTFWALVGAAMARRTLDAGFTTVRNVGSSDFEDVGLRQAIDGGYLPGPRVVTATWAIGATGGHCDDNEYPPSFDRKSSSVVNSPEEARAKVRWLHKYGAQLIKICATGGVFSAGDSVGGQQLTFDEMKAIADEAHMLGLKVAAHAHGDEGIRTAILAGIDTIEHASLASDATIKLAVERKTWFDMDIYNDDYILATGTSNGTSQESLDKERSIGLKQRQTFQRAVRAGVPMLFGTDAGIYPHGDNARQFAKMVEWGMTPLQAIQAATVSAAKALGREADVGAIAVGRLGDMIAVDGDPLRDVRTLEHVAIVIKNGVVVKGQP